MSLFTAGLSIFISGLGIITQSWQANAAADSHASKVVKTAQAKPNPNVPSTNKPAATVVDDYEVPADHPRYLNIPVLGVHARVLSVGLTNSGAVGTPGNVYDTAWYNGSAKPGQPGATLIDGHVSSWTSNGVFYGLKQLSTGDQLQIETGDSRVILYKVIAVRTYAANSVDMNAVLSPIAPSKSGLNLISCGGDVIAGTNDFSQRIVVFAEQIN